jgi:hypothetical protein
MCLGGALGGVHPGTKVHMGWVECISFVSAMAYELDGLRARASIGWMGRMDGKIPWTGKWAI